MTAGELTTHRRGLWAVIGLLAFWAGALWVGLPNALPLIFAASPASALITVVGGSDLVLAWPLDVTVWIVLGINLSGPSRSAPRTASLFISVVAAALLYGWLMSTTLDVV